MTSARSHVAAALKTLLPKGWKIIPHQDNFDALSKQPVVMIRQQRITPSPQAPLGAHAVDFEVWLIDPASDPAVAETSLDDEVDTLLYALEDNASLSWSEAERIPYDGTYQAWNIRITVTTLRKEPS